MFHLRGYGFLLLLLFVEVVSNIQNINALHAQPARSLAAQSTKKWHTRSGLAPVVIARGGASGLFPDQTLPAYVHAVTSSVSPIALFCDLQLAKDGGDICRTGLDLSNSTQINQNSSYDTKQYLVNGKAVTGVFAIDYNVSEILKLTATQSIQSRTNIYDGIYPILQLEDVLNSVGPVVNNAPYLVWLNVQYPGFFNEHGLDLALFVLSAMKAVHIDYISSPEVSFLKSLKVASQKSKTKLVFQFLDAAAVEPSTNVTYGDLLKNLKAIASFASGILVPKSFIWPVDDQRLYLEPSTTLVQDSHKVGLEVYASGFVNDAPLPVYNYSFNPIQEYLQFISGSGPIVDGVMTDFPITASEAIACYSNFSEVASSQLENMDVGPIIVSHNGASGDYPGCTQLAYEGAIKDGADYIDCPIQMTKDGVPICRESPDLLISTDVSLHSEFFPSRQSSITQFQESKGVFSINMTWSEINNLKAVMYSPEQEFGVFRNGAFDRTQDILRLSDFLAWASQNASKAGILINIQYAYFIETSLHLDVIGSVISALDAAGYGKSSQILIQSEDSAVLKRFQRLTSYTLVYYVKSEHVSITKETVQQIKQLASIVTLPRGLIAPSNTLGFLDNSSDVVGLFKAQNVTVFVSYLRSEFVALAFDYEADPTLELHTMAQAIGVDGIMTDFPATARAYLGNGCRNLKTGTSAAAYSMFLVTPGVLLTQTVPPNIVPTADQQAPDFSVAEPALPPSIFSVVSPASGSAEAKPPGTTSNAGFEPFSFLFTSLVVLFNIVYVMVF